MLRSSIFYFALSIGTLWMADYSRHGEKPPLDPLNLATAIRERANQFDLLIASSFEKIAKDPKRPETWPKNEFVFLYTENDSLLAWNGTRVPIPDYLPERDTVRFFSNSSGSYLQFSKRFGPIGLITAVVPLVQVMSNDDAISRRSQNQFLFGGLDIQISSPGRPDAYPIGVRGQEWFRVNFISLNESSLPQWYQWLGLCIGFIFLFLFFRSLIHQSGTIGIKVGLATIFIFLIRGFMLWRAFPGTSGKHDYLNPQFFASIWFNDSPLEFLFNSLALFILAVWVGTIVKSKTWKPFKFHKIKSSWIELTAVMIVSIGLFILVQVWTDTLYHHARISLDFRFLPELGVTDYLLLISLLLCQGTVIVLLKNFHPKLSILVRSNRNIFFQSLIIAVGVWFVYQWAAERPYTFSILTGLIVLSILLALPVRTYIFFRRYSRYFFWYVVAVGLAAQMAWMVWQLEEERMVKDLRFRIQPLEEQRDLYLEFLVRSAAGKIRRDESIRVMAEGPLPKPSRIENKVRDFHLEHDLTELNPDVKYLMPDSVGQMLGDQHSIPMTRLDSSDSLTIYSGSLAKGNQLTAGYWFLIPLSNAVGSAIGLRLNLPVDLDRILPYFRAGTITDYAFAVTSEKGIRFTQGRFDYSRLNYKILNDSVYQAGFQLDGWYHLVGSMGRNQKITVSVSNPRLENWLTNFSFWLVVFNLTMLFMRFKWQRQLFPGVISYATRIQLYVFTGMLIPLFLVIVVVIRNVSEEHIKELTALRENLLLRTASKLGSAAVNGNIIDKLKEHSEVNGFPLVWFDSNRLKRISSENLQSPYLPSWEALQRLYSGAGVFSNWEQGEAGEFMNSYTLVRSESTGMILGVLSMPLTDPLINIKAERMEAIASVLRVAVPFILVFLALSALLTRRLIQPVKRISKALRATSLDGPRVKIQPEGKDELGIMLTAYNGMLDKLEESRRALAEKERESLWREMARRVAHEIRNPLTPIRLSLQRLQQQFRKGESDNNRSIETIESVLHQTNILSNIAGSFSDLAKMPELKPESFDAVGSINKMLPGFSGMAEKSIRFESPKEVVKVWFDQAFFSRIINNLVLNAFQSAEGRIEVEIQIKKIPEGVEINFSDDGPGIPNDVQGQIFKPYFTTRRDGTGLGLTMIKQGVEQVGGKISFVSTPGRGTTFTVVLPEGK